MMTLSQIQTTQKDIRNKISKNVNEQPYVVLQKLPSAMRDFPEFKKILEETPAISDIATDFTKREKAAIGAQRKYKILAFGVLVSLLMVSIFSVLQANLGEELAQAWYVKFASPLFSFLALFGSFALFDFKPMQDWMSARAEAEVLRVEYFRECLKHLPENNIELVLTYLEFFYAYQLKVQLNYYEKRGTEHNTSLRRKSFLASIGAALAVASSLGLSDFISENGIAALAAVGAAISLFANRWQEISQNNNNARRYNFAFKTLTNIKRQYEQVIADLVKEDTRKNVLTAYVEGVHRPMIEEHKQWLQDEELMQKQIEALNSAAKARGK